MFLEVENMELDVDRVIFEKVKVKLFLIYITLTVLKEKIVNCLWLMFYFLILGLGIYFVQSTFVLGVFLSICAAIRLFETIKYIFWDIFDQKDYNLLIIKIKVQKITQYEDHVDVMYISDNTVGIDIEFDNNEINSLEDIPQSMLYLPEYFAVVDCSEEDIIKRLR